MNASRKKMLKQFIAEAQKLSLYEVGATIEGLAKKLGKPSSEIVKLNSNENFFFPLDFVRNVLREVIEEIDPRIYPRDELSELKQLLCHHLCVSPKEIVMGTGSDPRIDLISRIFLKQGDEAISISPTFSIYERCVRIQGALYKAIPLKGDFSLDIERIRSSITPRTKVIYLCSPNNPTANQFPREDLMCLAEDFDGIVALDEAYVDFSGGSVIDLCQKLENLVVFRTFSKVFGLAGLRIGYAIAEQNLATVIDERYQMPYNVSLVTLKTAIKVLQRIDIVNDVVDNVKSERKKLIEKLNKIDGVQAFDSDTNFVLFQANKNSNVIYEQLLGKGVIVRNIGCILGLENCLRVTVAPPFMMEKFLTAFKRVMKE